MEVKHRTERGFDRMVNFSDAVIAIAITLLVLPLMDLVQSADSQDLTKFWHDNNGAFIAYVAGFFLTALFWTIHHRTFEYFKAYDEPLLWLNFIWLLLIAILPFISAAGGDPDDKWPTAMLMFDMALLSVLLGLMVVYGVRNPELFNAGADWAQLRLFRSWAYGGFFAGLGVLAMFVGPNALYGLFALGPLGYVVNHITDRREAELEKREAAGSAADEDSG